MIMLALIIILGLAGLIVTIVWPLEPRAGKPSTMHEHEVRRRPF
jgi:hypothetical protein